MAAQSVLGNVPQNLWVVVNPGCAWVQSYSQQDGSGNAVVWPAGTSARLVISDPMTNFTSGSLAATVAGNLLSWNITGSVVDTWPDGSFAQIFLTYGGNAEALWLSGTLSRKS